MDPAGFRLIPKGAVGSQEVDMLRKKKKKKKHVTADVDMPVQSLEVRFLMCPGHFQHDRSEKHSRLSKGD